MVHRQHPFDRRTWSCTSGVRRSITISSTHPCEAPLDTAAPPINANASGPASPGQEAGGGFPLVNISENCAQSSFGVGMVFLTVAAQGDEDTSFTVMASLLGKVRGKRVHCVGLLIGWTLRASCLLIRWGSKETNRVCLVLTNALLALMIMQNRSLFRASLSEIIEPTSSFSATRAVDMIWFKLNAPKVSATNAACNSYANVTCFVSR